MNRLASFPHPLAPMLPAQVTVAADRAVIRFLEFFAANIRDTTHWSVKGWKSNPCHAICTNLFFRSCRLWGTRGNFPALLKRG